MTVYTPSPASATAGGYTVTALTNTAVQPARATAGGYGVLVQGAAPAQASEPDALRLEILNRAGTQLSNDFVDRRSLNFLVEHNGTGHVNVEIDLDKLTNGVDDALIAPDNLYRVHFGDLAAWPFGVAEGFVTAAPPVKNPSGRWTLTVQCPGTWDVLDFGVLWPPAGATGDTREFSYTAGQTGPAWVPEEWGTPNGYLVTNSFRWAHKWPRGWNPKSKARWLWSSSPEKNSAEGSRKFVGDPFTLTSTRNVRFSAAGDDDLKLYLNGARIKRKGRGAWKRTTRFIRRLKAGTYIVAAEVANLPGGDNKSGFACEVELLKADGTRDSWLLRSTTSSFKVKTGGGYFGQVPLPPDGWYPAAVLHQHVVEAAGRGADFHSAIVQTFTTAVDSAGTPWTEKGQAEYEISTSGAQLGEMVRSSGVDVAMLPGLRLSAWRSRGFDLRDRVVISTPLGLGWPSRTWARVRTVGLTHHESGWTETAGDPAIAAEFGRREMPISGGGTDGDLQAAALAAQALNTAGTPEETMEAVITSADLRAGAPRPFVDFNVADIVTFETVGGFTPVKVMSIAGAEDPTKRIKFTIAGYPV